VTITRSNQIYIILIQITIFILLGLRTLKNTVPFYFKHSDPAYEYLINGINLIYGMTPGHADHPGSTVQWTLSLTHRIYFALAGKSIDIRRDFVEFPENYALTFSIFSILLHAIIIFCITIKLYKTFQNVLNLFFPTIFIIIGFRYFDQLVGIKPENFLILTSGLLVYGLLDFEVKTELKNRLTPIVYGIILGIGVSTKVTFLLFTPIFFLLKGIKEKNIFIVIFISTLFILNINLYGNFNYKWFLNIIFNGGRHGQEGSKNFLRTLNDLRDVTVFFYPSILFLIILSLILIVLNKKNKIVNLKKLRIIKINYLFVFLGLLLVVKESYARDFVIIIPFISLLITVHLSTILKMSFTKKNPYLILASILLPVITIMLTIIAFLNTTNMITENETYALEGGRTVFEDFHKLNSEKGHIIITDYDTPTKFAALQFGNVMYGESAVKEQVDEKYPTSLYIIADTIFNGKGEKIGCQLFSQFKVENRKIYIFVRSPHEIKARLNSSVHGYDFVFVNNFLEFKESGLDWKIIEIASAECRNK
jgi:hypothetical protein